MIVAVFSCFNYHLLLYGDFNAFFDYCHFIFDYIPFIFDDSYPFPN